MQGVDEDFDNLDITDSGADGKKRPDNHMSNTFCAPSITPSPSLPD